METQTVYKTLRERIIHTPRRGKQLSPALPPATSPLIKLLDSLWPWDASGNYPGRQRLVAMLIGWTSPKSAMAFARGRCRVGDSKIAYRRAAAYARALVARLNAIIAELDAVAAAPPKKRSRPHRAKKKGPPEGGPSQPTA
jgi:hypothetical protein